MNRLNGKIAVSGNLGGDIGAKGKMSGRLGAAQKVYEKDYNNLFNKPQIEGNTLEGDKTFDDLGMTPLSAQELADMWNN